MAKQTILTGTVANDRTGDTIRSAFTKANANFTELYNAGIQGAQGIQGTQGIQGASGSGGGDLAFDSNGDLIINGNIVVGVAADDAESHFVIDASNYWTSIQWKNFTSPQDPTAVPFECQSQLLRVFSGTNAINGHEELVAVSAVRNTGTNYNGLMFSTSDGKIPDAPYNDGIGTRHDWILKGDGSTILPNGGKVTFGEQNGDAFIQAGMGFRISSREGIALNAVDATDPNNLIDHGWYFSPQGKVYFPNLSVDLHNGGVQTGQVLQFGDESYQAIITGPTPTGNNNAQRLIIQGQKGSGTGEGGDVYVWAGDADTNGGDIKIYAGDADNVSSGNGGYINIDAGNGFNYGGQLNLRGGDSNEYGGSVSITSGYGTISSGNITANSATGYFQINNSTCGWSFKNNGALVYPTNAIPTTSKGAAGDVVGSVVFGPSYIYYCIQSYTDGAPDIWKRVAWSNDTW